MFFSKNQVNFILLSMVLFFLFDGKSIYGQSTVIEKPAQDQVLSCSEVKSRVNQMLDLHYFYKEYSEELSQRTYSKIFENLDPSKIFFSSSDLNRFEFLKNDLGKKINKSDCKFLFDIYNVFLKRVHTRVEQAQKILKKPLVFTPTQYIATGKVGWALNEDELQKRFKERILFQYLNLKDSQSKLTELNKKIESSYLRLEKKYTNLSQDKLYSIFLNSFAQSLDPHSSHMLPAEQDSFTIHISNKLEGIGTQLAEVDGYIVVKSIIPGGVAEKDGRLKVNDKLIAVDSGNGEGFQDLTYVDVDKAVDFIRGRKGTEIKLVVLRSSAQGNEKISLSLIRDEISLKNESVRAAIFNYKGQNIGVIKIPSFYTDLKCKNKLFVRCQGVAYDVEHELKNLLKSGATGILIDLRNDGGGDFSESIKLTSLFIPYGVVVQTADKNKSIVKQETIGNSWVYKGPLVVLINRFSASASEIFAGAIQDYRRGIIVGDDHTYGKATVQVVQEIPGSGGRRTDGALKVTQNKFYRPSGSSNQRIGVHSDILNESIYVAYDIGEQNLDYALPLDTINPAKGFQPFQDLNSLILKLKQLSEERMSKNIQYKALIAKIKRIKSEKNKLLPLNPANLKSIENWKNADDQLNISENSNTGDKIIQQDDLQLMESLAITADSVQLSKGASHWIGFRN